MVIEIERENYLKRLKSLKDSPDIKVITGMRRSGKSVLLGQFMAWIRRDDPLANIISIDFTKLEFESIRDYHKLHQFVEERYLPNARNYLMVDEVQLCENFEKTINSLHSSRKFDIYLTGSNAFLLSSDLATLFTGRCMSIKVFPFSFVEFMEYFGVMDSIDEAFDDYVLKGGLPGSYVYRNEKDRVANLFEVYTTIVQRDLIEKFKLGNPTAMNRVAEFLMDNIGNITSPNNVCKTLVGNKVETSHVTAAKYIEYICRSFIFDECKRYDLKGRKHLETLSKYYLYDHGLRFAVLGTRSLDYGRVYENIVYMELLRRGYDVYVGKLYEKEVDFVAMKGSEKFYIQVSDDISHPATLARELDPLQKIKDEYPKILLARTHHPELDQQGIRVLDIARWLTGKESGDSVADRIRARTKRALVSKFLSVAGIDGAGHARFDFLANNGCFTVEGLGESFETQWSEAGANSVHAYKDRVELLGVKAGCGQFPLRVEEFESFDFMRRSVVVPEGGVVVFMNKNGRFLAVKVVGVSVQSHGGEENALEIEYRVY